MQKVPEAKNSNIEMIVSIINEFNKGLNPEQQLDLAKIKEKLERNEISEEEQKGLMLILIQLSIENEEKGAIKTP